MTLEAHPECDGHALDRATVGDKLEHSRGVSGGSWRVRGPSDLDVVAGCAALLLTADYPPYELTRWVNEACLAHCVPFILTTQRVVERRRGGPKIARG